MTADVLMKVKHLTITTLRRSKYMQKPRIWSILDGSSVHVWSIKWVNHEKTFSCCTDFSFVWGILRERSKMRESNCLLRSIVHSKYGLKQNKKKKVMKQHYLEISNVTNAKWTIFTSQQRLTENDWQIQLYKEVLANQD